MSVETLKAMTKEAVFKPAPSAKESNASKTDRNARAIQQIETDARNAKTIRLRNARMAYEQTIIMPDVKKKKTKKSPKKT